MKDNNNELFAEVDSHGNVIAQMTRGEAHSGTKRLHAVVHLHLFNSKGELYLQHRPSWKDIQPNRWDTACGGHVGWGESIAEALLREVVEELGIPADSAEFLGSYIFESSRERELVYVHRMTYDGDVHPSADELDGGRFFPIDQIIDLMGKDFFTPNFESEYRWLQQFHI